MLDIRVPCALLIAILRLSAALADDSLLTLDLATDRALAHNAKVRGMRAAVAAAQERPAQAVALPNPTLMFGEMESTGDSVGSAASQQRVSLQQAFPWFGKRRLREQIAEKDAEAVRHRLDATLRDVRMNTRTAFYELYAQQRVIDVTGDELQVLAGIAESAKTMVAAGTREQTDMIQAQTEQTRLQQRLIDLEASANTLRARLNALLDRPSDASLGTLAKPPVPALPPLTATLYEQAGASSPEVLSEQAQADRYALDERLRKKEYAPDYSLGLEYRESRESDDMMMVTLGVELPIRFGKVAAGVREAAQMREASLASRDDALRQNAFEVDDARARFDAASRTLDLTRRELLPQAEARLNAHQASYRSGTADFMDVLESERFRLETKIMEIRAEAELGAQAARFERAAGILPVP